jgi:hypothetical protein
VASALPAIAVLVVAYTVLVGGRARPVMGARVRGGPTEHATAVSFRVELVERDGDDERPIGGRDANVVLGLPGGVTKSFSRFLDSDGSAAVSLERLAPLTGPVHLRLLLAGRDEPVHDGDVSASVDTWTRGARRRGEWVDGRTEKGLVVRASAERGVFAVPFQDGLRVEVRRQGVPAARVVVTASSETADIEPSTVSTDASGKVRLLVRPREHAASVTLRASAPDGATVSLEVALAVVPGALHAALGDEGVVVESPIARTRAYVAIVGERERFGGGPVTLSSDGSGNARGTFPLPNLPSKGPLWAVVSSEPDLHSAALVGWPIRAPDDATEPGRTFDVPDVLLADGIGKAMARERTRVRSVRLSGAVFAACALALSALIVTRRARRAATDLETHLKNAGEDAEFSQKMASAPEGGAWLMVVAVLCLGLAAALIGVFVVWR